MDAVADRPFALPSESLEIVLDLPFPPSVNHIWRRAGKRMIRSARYMRWLTNADYMILANRQYPRRKIVGHFEAEMLLSEKAGVGDLDNRVKCLLDWCVSRDVVYDDVYCRKLRAEWVAHDRAPHGVKLTLRSLHG